MTEISAEDLKLLEEAKAIKARKVELSSRRNTIGSFLVVVALGIAASFMITWKVCAIREANHLEAHDAAIRNAINEDFAIPPSGQDVVQKMDLWTIFTSLGYDSINAHKMADWNGLQMGNCYRELQGMKTGGYVPSPAVSIPSVVTGPDPRLEAVVIAMYNRLHPGLGDAIKSLIEKQQPAVRGN